MPVTNLPVVVANAGTATFECTFGRGCEGVCCRNGRPSVDPAEQARIAAVLPRALPLLRPEARRLVEASGLISNRTKLGNPMVRVADGWCVLFNRGCVLHAIGAEDGDPLQYKPTQCALFPLEPDGGGSWYVRQWGYQGERWNELFCLNPANTTVPAVESLAGELALAAAVSKATAAAGAVPSPVGAG
ncbi:MAG: DUF3109 family protein [Gemmataceae bacterium]|nr:DUF3109 family protein [Gemmataceae bacterium]